MGVDRIRGRPDAVGSLTTPRTGARAGGEEVAENLPVGDARNLTRVGAPVIRFQTQFEVVNSGAFQVRQREADFPWVRFYEGAGLTHVDTYLDLTAAAQGSIGK